MSCFVMEPRAIAAIASNVSKLLNMGYEAWGFSAPDSLYDALSDCTDIAHFYQEEAIYKCLYEVNARAYAGRYNDPGIDTDAPKVDFCGLHIWEHVEYNGHYIIMPWHYKFLKLVDCYNYQTSEDATRTDPLKKAMDELSHVLCAFIARNSDYYEKAPWGNL